MKDDLPPTPTSAQLPPPPPPPKIVEDEHYQELEHPAPFLPPIDLSNGSLDPGLIVPMTPTTPISPVGSGFPSSSESKPKKTNPLIDLIETEKVYVDTLTGIIRKVAAAWSRNNLPPKELDSIFRAVEGVYKSNRALLAKLKDIGTNPSSPKALGDLLMRWIDDLEVPYTSYCEKYCVGFDTWDPIVRNVRLPDILQTFSEANPPPQAQDAVWTLDSLFTLPKSRLKYYKKLYGRLLKSTAPGRSDHKLLVGAIDKLESLMATLDNRANVDVALIAQVPLPDPSQDEVVIDMRNQPNEVLPLKPQRKSEQPDPPRSSDVGSGSSSGRGSMQSGGGERFSTQTTSTSHSRASTQTMNTPISDLERRLSSERCLDIFTMTPKAVRLQISPPTLTYTRELRFSSACVLRFTPQSTGVEVVHQRGHIILLSDLFLICEKMTPEEKQRVGPDGPDTWLCYPPLAGKVLRVNEVPGQDNVFQVAIMRRETLTIETESIHARNYMISEFRECVEFASTAPPPSKGPVPAMPPLPDFARAPGPLSMPNSRAPSTLTPPGGITPRSMSPISAQGMIRRLDEEIALASPNSDRGFHGQMGHLSAIPPMTSSDSASMRSFASAPTPPLFSNGGRPGIQESQRGPPNGYPQHPPPFNAQGPYGGPPPQFSQHPPGAPPNFPPGQGGPPPFNQHPPYQNPNAPQNYPPRGRMPTDPNYQMGGARRSISSHSLHSQFNPQGPAPPMPAFPGGHPPNLGSLYSQRNLSAGSLPAPPPRPLLPSANNIRAVSVFDPSFQDPSPPGSPNEQRPELPKQPVVSTVSAAMKCKVFLKREHAQWKNLGSAKLKLYRQQPTNIKQLVVEADNKQKSIMISTIVLTDGVERVGKTGVAVELSDKGQRTGIIYMIQLRNEESAGGFFESLLAGSDRTKS